MIYRELFTATKYEPHAGQLKFHASDARFKLLIAGARFGKSLAASRDIVPELVGGGTRGWFVAPTYALAMPEFQYLLDALSALGGMPKRLRDGGRAGHSLVRTIWGSDIWCLSARLPYGLLGQEIDWLLLCEAAHLAQDVYLRYLRARLATRSGRLLVPSTPRGRNWLQGLYELGLGGHRDWQSFRFATWDNPLISDKEIESARATLPESVFDEQYGGAFTAASGRVYREFEPELHVVQQLQAPPGAIIYKAIDFGYVNPFCCLWAAVDGDGRILVLREYHARELPVASAAGELQRIDDEFRERGYVIGPGFADPSGALERRMLADAGLHVLGARNDLRGGIEIVRKCLLRRADGTPGMLVAAACTELVREFEGYMWDERASDAEPLPRKKDDHALDALRYLCIALRHHTRN